MSLHGKHGRGAKMTEDEIMASVKLYCSSTKKEEDYEILAREVGFDVGAVAVATVSQPDVNQMVIEIVSEAGNF